MARAALIGLRYVISVLLWIVSFSAFAGFIGPIGRGDGVDFGAAAIAVFAAAAASAAWPSEDVRRSASDHAYDTPAPPWVGAAFGIYVAVSVLAIGVLLIGAAVADNAADRSIKELEVKVAYLVVDRDEYAYAANQLALLLCSSGTDPGTTCAAGFVDAAKP